MQSSVQTLWFGKIVEFYRVFSEWGFWFIRLIKFSQHILFDSIYNLLAIHLAGFEHGNRFWWAAFPRIPIVRGASSVYDSTNMNLKIIIPVILAENFSLKILASCDLFRAPTWKEEKWKHGGIVVWRIYPNQYRLNIALLSQWVGWLWKYQTKKSTYLCGSTPLQS